MNIYAVIILFTLIASYILNLITNLLNLKSFWIPSKKPRLPRLLCAGPLHHEQYTCTIHGLDGSIYLFGLTPQRKQFSSSHPGKQVNLYNVLQVWGALGKQGLDLILG